MSVETIGDVSEDPGPVLQLDPEHPVGKRIEDPTLDELRRPGHERALYRNRRGAKPDPPVRRCRAVHLHAHTATRLLIVPFELVSTLGPSLVTATVCSKYADSEPSDVQTVQPSGLM